MAPMLAMLQTLQAVSIKKEDLKTFKDEVREEMKAMIDAKVVQEAAANRQAGKGIDPFVTRDPWVGGQSWDAWNSHQSSTVSSSGSATIGQGDTSQSLRGKWHPQGEMARTAVGGAADKFHQKQTAATEHLEHVPTQVFIRG